MIRTVNKKVACRPIEVKSFLNVGTLSAITDRSMLELEVIFTNEDGAYKPGDKIYVSKDLENNDRTTWLKTVMVLASTPCILIPEEFILAHSKKQEGPYTFVLKNDAQNNTAIVNT